MNPDMKKYMCVLAALLLIVGTAAYCTLLGEEYSADVWIAQSAKSQSPTPTPKPVNRVKMPPVNAPVGGIVLTVPPNAAPDLTGKAFNPLSGLYISEEAAARRPFAVVFNNNEQALPQSGLSQADIIYEVLSEGSITRIIGIFQDFDSAKMGSIRSARHYFIHIALDYDAFFVHFGGSPQAYSALKELKIDNINGIYLDGGVKKDNFNSVVFWRDAGRYSISKMREHSAYTNAANLIAYAEKAKYRLNKKENASEPFAFYDKRSNEPDAGAVVKISVSYASNSPCVFEYDEKTGKYARFQNKGPQAHIDEEIGEQIVVDNVIVQLTSVKAIAGDTEGRRDVAIIGSGKGYLYTNGTVIPLKWSKSSHNSPTVWTYENGEQLTLNKGKTWICITNKEPVIE